MDHKATGTERSERAAINIERLKFYFWIVLVVALGLFAVNQGLEFFYKAHFLKAPCDLCTELNPQFKDCISPSAYPPLSLTNWANYSIPLT